MKKKSIDVSEARENFNNTTSYAAALDEYMEGEGYKWDRSLEAWVDDGSDADIAADHALQVWKERDL